MISFLRCLFSIILKVPHTNDAGVTLIKQWESLRLNSYKDKWGTWNIGYGFKLQSPMEPITTDQAERMLQDKLREVEWAVFRNIKSSVSSNQFSALVCLTYNIGIDHFEKSTLLDLVNQSKFLEASNQFLRWDHVNGDVVNGLLARRAAERELFLKSI